MTLYEINAQIDACVDPETGEIYDFELLDELFSKREEKLENIALFIKNEEAMAEQIKAEKLKLAARQTAHENKAKNLKKYLSEALEGNPFETAKVKVSFRRSEALIINEEWFKQDVRALEFVKDKPVEYNKAELKKALKRGETFLGVELEERRSINIG